MQYCLSDVSSEAPESLQQLSGLPLLVSQDFRTITFGMQSQGQGKATLRWLFRLLELDGC